MLAAERSRGDDFFFFFFRKFDSIINSENEIRVGAHTRVGGAVISTPQVHYSIFDKEVSFRVADALLHTGAPTSNSLETIHEY